MISYSVPTDAQISSIRKYIAKGHFPQIAAVLSGIPEMLFNKWMTESTKPGAHPQLIKFRANMDLGSAQVEDSAVDNWVSAFGKDWKASKEFLAVRFPDRWNPDVNKTSVTNQEDEAKKKVLNLLNNPEAQGHLEKLREMLGSD